MQKAADVKKVQANPTRTFDSPADVLTADLTDDEKRAILKSWEDEAHQLQTATEESMSGGEPSRLDEVRKAIDRLENRH